VRIPLSEPWRAFAELDRFSDEQCRAYVAAVNQERRASRAFSRVCSVAAFLFIVPIGAIVGDAFAPRVLDPRPVALVCALFPSLISMLLIRDLWLRGALRKHLLAAHCPACRYILLGLVVHDGAVQCPECGKRIVLSELGLTPESLIAPASS